MSLSRCARRPAYFTASALTSFALSLLLVYRTNAAYGRWAELRTACGRMLVHLRTLLRLVRCGCAHADSGADDCRLGQPAFAGTHSWAVQPQTEPGTHA